jgi:hypothetical protein
VEDALVSEPLPAPKKISDVPWLFEGLDNAPCSVITEI